MPAHRPSRSRQCGRQPRGPQLRRAALARGRAGAVHRTPGAEPGNRHYRGHPSLGPATTRACTAADRAGQPRQDERADLHPPLPAGSRDEPRRLAHPTARGARQKPAGVQRSPRGPDRPPRRVRHGGLTPPASVRRDRRIAPRLSANLPSGRWIRAPATASRQRIAGGLAGHADVGPGPAVLSRPPPGHLEAGLKPSPPKFHGIVHGTTSGDVGPRKTRTTSVVVMPGVAVHGAGVGGWPRRPSCGRLARSATDTATLSDCLAITVTWSPVLT